VSISTADTLLGDDVHVQTQPARSHPPWIKGPIFDYRSGKSKVDDQQSRMGQSRPVMVTLRDDQLGQIIQAISPPKQQRNLPKHKDNRHEDYSNRQAASHAYHPPRMTNISYAGNPSAAAFARKLSYPDLDAAQRSVSTRPSPDRRNATNVQKIPTAAMYHSFISSNKENHTPSQAQMPTAFPGASRVPTLHPFAPMISPCISNDSMRDGSSVFSEYPRDTAGQAAVLSEVQNKHGAVHALSNNGSVKSKKEGLIQNSPHLSDVGVPHDQSLAQSTTGKANTAQRPITRGYQTGSQSTPRMPPTGAPEIVEIIDVDAIDPGLDHDASQDAEKLSPFVPNHKPGMSSLDSTGLIERKLVSALVPEYGSFETRGATSTVMESVNQSLQDSREDTFFNISTGTFKPAGKRKRQGDEAGESPLNKREKGGQDCDELEGREVDSQESGSE
jgi:hypothetical protein